MVFWTENNAFAHETIPRCGLNGVRTIRRINVCCCDFTVYLYFIMHFLKTLTSFSQLCLKTQHHKCEQFTVRVAFRQNAKP